MKREEITEYTKSTVESAWGMGLEEGVAVLLPCSDRDRDC